MRHEVRFTELACVLWGQLDKLGIHRAGGRLVSPGGAPSPGGLGFALQAFYC